MSGLDLPAIRTALYEVLSEIENLYVYEFFPNTVTIFPSLIIWPPQRLEFKNTRELDTAMWELQVIIGSMSSPASQIDLEELLSGTGERSIREALYADKKLGGVVSNLRVTGGTTGLLSIPNNNNEPVLGFDLNVEIMA